MLAAMPFIASKAFPLDLPAKDATTVSPPNKSAVDEGLLSL